MTKLEREIAGMPQADIDLAILTLRETLTQMTGNGYTDRDAPMVDMTRNLRSYEAEIVKRKKGTKPLADIRERRMTDGERLALGLEPRDDE